MFAVACKPMLYGMCFMAPDSFFYGLRQVMSSEGNDLSPLSATGVLLPLGLGLNPQEMSVTDCSLTSCVAAQQSRRCLHLTTALGESHDTVEKRPVAGAVLPKK